MPWKQLFHAQSPDAIDRKLADLKCISLITIFQSVEISRDASMRKIFIADNDALVEMISPPCYQHISESLLGRVAEVDDRVARNATKRISLADTLQPRWGRRGKGRAVVHHLVNSGG